MDTGQLSLRFCPSNAKPFLYADAMARNNGSISVKNLLQQINARLDGANRICGSWDYVDNCGSGEDIEQIEVNLDAAFEGSLVLMEKLSLPDARRRVDKLYEAAKRDLAVTEYSVGMGEPYLGRVNTI
jgi:hypothetical protein